MLKIHVLIGSILFTVTAGVVFNASAQTMPKKYDDKCLENARKEYVACIARSGGNMSAQQQCDKEKVAAEAQCKIK